MNETDQAVIRAALWLYIWAKKSWLFKIAIPSACRENFLSACEKHQFLNGRH